MSSIQIRSAKKEDCELIVDFIYELACYDQAMDQLTATGSAIAEALFGSNPVAESIIAELDGVPAGFAVFYHNFSTWTGHKGLWIDDLFVREDARNKGIGKALFIRLAEIAHERNCKRMEWMVLNWNEKAIDFYQKAGALPLVQWSVFRMDESKIALIPEKRFSSSSENMKLDEEGIRKMMGMR